MRLGVRSGPSECGSARSDPWTRAMHTVAAQGDENVVRFKRMSLRLRGGFRPACNTSVQAMGKGSYGKKELLYRPQLWPEWLWYAWRTSIQGLEYHFERPTNTFTHIRHLKMRCTNTGKTAPFERGDVYTSAPRTARASHLPWARARVFRENRPSVERVNLRRSHRRVQC